MSETAIQLRRNPFATRRVRPGAMPYLFAPGMNAAALLKQLQVSGWRGAIVGAHGSGKSTLLATIVPVMERMGIEVRLISLHDGERRLTRGALDEFPRRAVRNAVDDLQQYSCPAAVLVIDGYEQLNWWSRRRLSARCRRRGWGLLITVHDASRASSMPIIFHTAADLASVQYLVDQVLPSSGGVIHSDDVAEAFRAHSGNVRETLFSLYDLFEQRRI
jgi:hypothetical protein